MTSSVLSSSDRLLCICLLCGELLASGVKQAGSELGACTSHVPRCGGEVGIFFLLQECCTLLIRRGKAAYFSPLYVDQFGERLRNNSQRGRPLFLDDKQVKQLEHMWFTNQVGAKVVSTRCAADRVIRENYY